MDEEENGWSQSASAWINSQGDQGDFSREFVLDPAIDRLLSGRSIQHVLDLGCGEGRFCRRLKQLYGISHVTGLDPTEPLLARARLKDPDGDYRNGRAEQLPFSDDAFDLVVSYLTLIDIPDLDSAIQEAFRVLKPGGSFLIANLNPFITACGGTAWKRDGAGRKLYVQVDNYLSEHADWQAWRGIRILNHHRPMARYMTCLLNAGFMLKTYEEPPAIGGPQDVRDSYNRVPYAHLMEWKKP